MIDEVIGQLAQQVALPVDVVAERRLPCAGVMLHLAPPFQLKTAVCASDSASNLPCDASQRCAV